MRDLRELRIGQSERLAPTASEIAQVEEAIGHELPESYLKVVKLCNGGHPELDTVYGESGAWGIDHFLPMTGDPDCKESVLIMRTAWAPELGDAALPIATDGGGNPFFLDFSSTPPAVCICLHDEDGIVRKIAESFESLIDSLQVNRDYR